MQTAVGPAPGQALAAKTSRPSGEAGSAAPPPSWRQIRPWGSPAGGGSGPPPARRSGPHRRGRRPSAPQPEGWGAPALEFLHHVFGQPGAERVHGPRVVQAAAQTPAEGWTAAGAAGGGLGETTEGACSCRAAPQRTRNDYRNAVRAENLRSRHCATSVRTRASARGVISGQLRQDGGSGPREAPPLPASSGLRGRRPLLWVLGLWGRVQAKLLLRLRAGGRP